jgi:hypothetical protein
VVSQPATRTISPLVKPLPAFLRPPSTLVTFVVQLPELQA